MLIHKLFLLQLNYLVAVRSQKLQKPPKFRERARVKKKELEFKGVKI